MLTRYSVARSLMILSIQLLAADPAQKYTLSQEDIEVLRAVVSDYNKSHIAVHRPYSLNSRPATIAARGMLPGAAGTGWIWGTDPAASEAADALVSNTKEAYELALPSGVSDFEIKGDGKFTISRPGYDRKHNVAIVIFGFNSGQYYLLKKGPDGWSVIKSASAWDT
jgi:hypothetical protein